MASSQSQSQSSSSRSSVATESAVITRVQGLLECSICLDRYENPKPLWCTHHYCKQCLEDIMTFADDGSIIIDCPMRCEAQTYLAHDETVDDLVASYDFLGLLDALQSKEDDIAVQVPICAYDKKCTKPVSVCCCETLMCSKCYTAHKRTSSTSSSRHHHHHHHRRNVVFNRREKKLRVLCDKHNAECTHMCLSHKHHETFLCKYCLQRDKKHDKHQLRTVEENVAAVKAELSCYSKETDIVFPFLKSTADNIRDIRKQVHELLDLRYELCLSQYTEFLKKKKEAARGKLKSVLETHMAQYRAIPKYCDEKISKDDVVLAIQRGTIVETILALSKLNCETLTLESIEDFCAENPLGSLHVETEAEVLISNPPIATLKLNIAHSNLTQNIEGAERDGSSPVAGCSNDVSETSTGRLKRTSYEHEAGSSGSAVVAKKSKKSSARRNAARGESDDVGDDVRFNDSDDDDDDSDDDDSDDDDDDAMGDVIQFGTLDSDIDVPDTESGSRSETPVSEND